MKSEIKRFVGNNQQFDGQILNKTQMLQLKGGGDGDTDTDGVGVQDLLDG